MDIFEKKRGEQEEFTSNLWNKITYHKGILKPEKEEPKTPQQNIIEEEIITPPQKHKKTKTPIIALIILTSLIIVFLLLHHDQTQPQNSTNTQELKIPQDYISYYKFDQGGKDESKNNDAELKNAAIYSDILRDNVLSLDKTSLAFIGDKTKLENIQEITISMWVKSQDNSHTLISKELIWKIDFDNYKLRFMTGDNWENILYSQPLEISEWTHILAIHNSSQKCFYINGKKDNCINTNKSSFGDNNYPAIIGSTQDGQDSWSGFIDDVMIYNRGLNQEEIKAIFELQKKEALPTISPFAKLWDKIRN